MKRARLLLLLLAFALLPVKTNPQVQTGAPPFGTFSTASGPDLINLGNLNAHFSFPIVNKQGRGLNFSYSLTFDSSVWYPVGSSGSQSWQPVTNWGWATQGGPLTGTNGWKSSTVTDCWIYDHGVKLPAGSKTTYYDFVFTDIFGTPHPLSGSTSEASGDYGCPNYPLQPLTSYAEDGSGWYMNFTSSSTTFTSPTGAILQPSVSHTDTNGNQISLSGGTFTDTLGDTALTVSGTAPNPVTFTYTSPSGGTPSYTVKYTAYTVRTNFGCSGIREFGPTSESLVSEIDLPDQGTVPNDRYLISYESTLGFSGDVTGRIASITLPTGGTISYSYSGGSNGITCADGSTATLKRATPDGTWTYAHTENGSAWTTTVTDPQGNNTVLNFQGIYQTEEQAYSGSSTLLKTIFTCYNGAAPNCNGTAVSTPITKQTVYTQWPSGLESEVNTAYNSLGLPTEEDDYDYGSGSPGSIIRKKLTSYASLGNNIGGLPSSITIENGAGTTIGETTFGYDAGSVAPTSGTPQHVAVSGSRGNLTSVNYLVQGSTYLTRSFTYFDTGNVQTATDVNNAQTTFNYANATSTCGNAFPTSVTEAISGLSKSMTWNCTGGVNTSVTDENSQTVSTAYSDAYYWRPASTKDQEGNQTNVAYYPNSSYPNTSAVVRSLLFNGSNSETSDYQYMDSLGRTYVDQHIQSPTASSLDSTSFARDSNGRLSSTSGPCAIGWAGTCSGPTTTQTYDALNRPLQTTDGGGGTVSLTYTANDVLQIIGPKAGSENLKERQMEYNSLGELTSVCEITSATGGGSCGQNTPATGYLTKYTYDALGDLLTVTQNAQSSPTQTRTFTYDELGRMTSETNPESGTTTYSYDSASGTGCASSSPGNLIKVTDAAGNWTCYDYDALHRVTDVGNSNQSATNSCKRFRYDDSQGVSGQRPNGVTVNNGMARVVEAETDDCLSPFTPITDEWFSYTARGEVSDLYQSTPHSSGYYHSSATYWANGVLDSLTAATGYANSYNVDGEGRVYSSGNGNLSSTTYNAASQPTIVIFGSLDSDSFTYDPNTFRMTQYKYNVNGQSVVGNLTWNANGTLSQLAITDPFNGANTQTCNYTHDDLARIASANCGSSFSDTYSYDAFGNLTKSGTFQFQPGYNANNQMTNGTTYNPVGDVLNDKLHSYQWDAYNRPTTIDSVSVTYDALGRMVEQGKSGSYTEIQYSPTGFEMELMNGQAVQKAFVPLPAGTAAVWASGSTAYYQHADWVGSARFASTSSRTMYNDLAYTPFGIPYAQAGSAGVTDISFAGNNEDTTTSLYDAAFREYGIQGRWPSPDPAGLAAANPANPQSWNRYAYVLNMPLLFADPSGLIRTPWGYDGPDPGESEGGGWNEFFLLNMALGNTDYPGCPYGDCSYMQRAEIANTIMEVLDGLGLSGIADTPANFGPALSPSPQSPTSTCTINNGHVTGVATGAGQAPGVGAFGFVPPTGSVAIDPLSLGLFPGAQTNALLGPNASQITFSFSPAPNVPSGFPATHTLGSILDPKARVGGVYFHGQYGFDIFGFSSVASADAVTETGQVTITFPSSLPVNCGGPLVDPVPPNPGLASNQPNTNGALSAFHNVHFQRRQSSASHDAFGLYNASPRALGRAER